MKELSEASYGRIYQHTRDNGTFAIIGSEDKDTHEDRYNELKELIKKYERKYGHLGYNKLSGTYKYQFSNDIANEKSVIIYGINKKDALSIAKQLNQESIIWKENTFFGIINVDGGILKRFLKSTLNFSNAIKQGIGSKLQSDQSRTFGYAFEGGKIMNKKNLSEAIMDKLLVNGTEYKDIYDFANDETVNTNAFIADGRYSYGDKIRFIANQLEESGNVDSYADENYNNYLLEVSKILKEAADKIDNLGEK